MDPNSLDPWLKEQLSGLYLDADEWAARQHELLVGERADREFRMREQVLGIEMAHQMKTVTLHLMRVMELMKTRRESIAALPSGSSALLETYVANFDALFVNLDHQWEGSHCCLCGFSRGDESDVE